MKFEDFNIYDIGTRIQMAGALFSDGERGFTFLFPDEQLQDLTLEKVEATHAQWSKLIRQTDLVEVEVLANASDSTLAKVVLRKSTRQINQRTSWAVWRRDGYACRYCGVADQPLTVDHLVTWEDGGPSTEDNLLSSCSHCNAQRGNQEYAAWLESPYYYKKSQGISKATDKANRDLVDTLGSIPRRIHKQSR